MEGCVCSVTGVVKIAAKMAGATFSNFCIITISRVRDSLSFGDITWHPRLSCLKIRISFN